MYFRFAYCFYTFLILLFLGSHALAVTYEGTVRGKDGNPLPRTLVVAITPAGDYSFGYTRSNGRYALNTGSADYHVISVFPRGEGTRQDLTYYNYLLQNRIVFPKHRSTVQIDFTLPKVGNLVLRAFDGNGNLMRHENFLDKGRYGDSDIYMYAVDMHDEVPPSLPTRVHDESSRKKDEPEALGLPCMLVPLNQRFVMQMMFWEMDDVGKLLLEMNPSGDGYRFQNKGEVRVVNVNFDLAQTQYRKAAQRLNQPGHASLKASYAETLTQADGLLEQAGRATTDKDKARLADRALKLLIPLRESFELAKARQDIPRYRTGTARIRFVDADHQPVSGVSLDFHQTANSFLFGVSELTSPELRQQFRDIGIAYSVFMPVMGAIQYEPGKFSFEAVDEHFDVSGLHQDAFLLKPHGMLYFYNDFIPDFYRQMDFNGIKNNLSKHIETVVRQYRDKVDLWEAINEPATTNPLKLTRPQLIDLIRLSINTIDANDPGKKILINDAGEFDFGLKNTMFDEQGRPAGEDRTSYANLLMEVEKANIDYDIIGLQFYPGYRLGGQFSHLEGPAMDLGWFSDYLDDFHAFNKEIHVTEFSLPSTYERKWRNGWWRGPWTPELQSEYLTGVYTIAFSKPLVQSITWWNGADKGAFVQSGGLLDDQLRPKPAFLALKDLIARWRSDGSVDADSGGTVVVKGFGGQYEGTARVNGKSNKITFEIIEQKQTTIEIKLDEL